MTEQLPGELTYEYTIQPTRATSYGVPALDALLSSAADIPRQGARYDLAFQGPIVGRRHRLARQAMLGQRAGHRRSNPSI